MNILSSSSLKKLLEDARTLIIEQGTKTETQRGTTFSLNNVMLTWEKPQEDASSYWYWDKEADDWYQKHFVEKRDENDPAVLPLEGQLLYSYTYAHRSRFWDGGWGYVLAVVRALQQAGITSLDQDPHAAQEAIAAVARFVHLQAVLAVFFWLGPDEINRYLKQPQLLEDMLQRMRQDTLRNAIDEIQNNPYSRRAVTVSFVYPAIDFALKPAMSVPPYQFFQLLPAEATNAPVASSHVHRSLDVAGGAQLDFHHDLAWLREAGQFTNRPVGAMTVVAHNLHLYVQGDENNNANLTSKTSIQEWLNSVSDGYAAQSNEHVAFMEQDVYKEHIAALLKAWHH
ncbi:MAG: thymidylate synthase [Patescibacteria group bacterium]|jgi:thymidylate synthase